MGTKKFDFFFSKKFEIEFDLYFDLCQRAEIIQVGLNMNLYDDIGDASSSLLGSTSSSYLNGNVPDTAFTLKQDILNNFNLFIFWHNIFHEFMLFIKYSQLLHEFYFEFWLIMNVTCFKPYFAA